MREEKPTVEQEQSENNEEISLKELVLYTHKWFRYILSRWLIILIISVLFGIAGFIYAALSKPIYTAELSFVLEEQKSGGGFGAAAGLASQLGFDLDGGTSGAFSGDNLIELMKSRSIIQKTLLSVVEINHKEKSLADLYISINNLAAAWKLQSGMAGINFYPIKDPEHLSLKQDSILSDFHKQLLLSSVSVDKIDRKLSIISVRVNSINELFAKYFAENLVKIVSDYYIETKTKKESENVAILKYQVDSVRKQLNNAISGVASSLDVNPNPNPSLQILRIPSQRRQIDVQANTAILTELVKNLEISEITLRKETPLIQVIDKPVLPLEKKKPGKLRTMILSGFAGMSIALFLLTMQALYKKLMS